MALLDGLPKLGEIGAEGGAAVKMAGPLQTPRLLLVRLPRLPGGFRIDRHLPDAVQAGEPRAQRLGHRKVAHAEHEVRPHGRREPPELRSPSRIM